ncbi:hypothetical protein SH668x_003414 [Planctomicrobium sp. SH668]|uniref:hypothetical protein n=1 Tax=Planctomicrobium sp. SH668 TaxID=3448126 RepID=UPI003F5B054B
MTARFSGTRQLSRRRRRLAQEACDLGAPNHSQKAQRIVTDVQMPGSDGLFDAKANKSPRTLIPSSWKAIAAIGLVGFFMLFIVIWLGATSAGARYGIAEIASLTNGALPRYFSTALLLVCTQLSLLIYWHRSRSRKDFLGRYRIWGWASLFWGIACLATATQFHEELISKARTIIPFNGWRGDHLYWFLPLAIGFLTINRHIGREVRPSHPSVVSWRISTVLGVMLAGLFFGFDLLVPSSWRVSFIACVTLIWQFSIALTYLIHSRYVTHVTNEASGKFPSLYVRFCRATKPYMQRFGEQILSFPIKRGWLDFAQQSEGESKSADAVSRAEVKRATAKTKGAPDSPTPVSEPAEPGKGLLERIRNAMPFKCSAGANAEIEAKSQASIPESKRSNANSTQVRANESSSEQTSPIGVDDIVKVGLLTRIRNRFIKTGSADLEVAASTAPEVSATSVTTNATEVGEPSKSASGWSKFNPLNRLRSKASAVEADSEVEALAANPIPQTPEKAAPQGNTALQPDSVADSKDGESQPAKGWGKFNLFSKLRSKKPTVDGESDGEAISSNSNPDKVDKVVSQAKATRQPGIVDESEGSESKPAKGWGKFNPLNKLRGSKSVSETDSQTETIADNAPLKQNAIDAQGSGKTVVTGVAQPEEPPAEAKTSWGSRLMTGLIKGKAQPAIEAESETGVSAPASPAASAVKSQSSATEVKEKTKVNSQEAAADSSEADAISPAGWGEKMKTGLLGRWKRRVDEPKERSDVVPAPHVSTSTQPIVQATRNAPPATPVATTVVAPPSQKVAEPIAKPATTPAPPKVEAKPVPPAPKEEPKAVVVAPKVTPAPVVEAPKVEPKPAPTPQSKRLPKVQLEEDFEPAPICDAWEEPQPVQEAPKVEPKPAPAQQSKRLPKVVLEEEPEPDQSYDWEVPEQYVEPAAPARDHKQSKNKMDYTNSHDDYDDEESGMSAKARKKQKKKQRHNRFDED